MSVRILLVDDQELMRLALRLMFAGQPEFEVIGEARDGLEAVRTVQRLHPDVTVMDIRMPQMDGIEATRQILAADPRARIVMLTTFDIDDCLDAALRAGATAALLKDAPPAELLAAVRKSQDRAVTLGV